MEDPEDEIAVVGIGCNFPGGEGLENFWKVLVDGKNCAVPVPKERFDLASWYDSDDNKLGKSRTAKAALIEGFNEFDHRLFDISDSEVEHMDPQQKQLLQCAYRALENAGMPMENGSGSRTGVFFGLMNRDYEQTAAHMHPTVINHWTGTGLAMSIAANRVSYIFNFTGPSMTIDCACSSSLVALHLACQAIKQGDCEMALCGGVSCIIEPRVFVALSKAKMISPEGTSKPFSSRADGYGRGEGCGIVLLKPLTKAIQDHDHIWGIISNTAVNQDGHTVMPITKPSMVQQEELLRRIYSQSDIINVQYIEAHGTGTPVGDPTEAGSISNVIAKARPPGTETLRIGSVKSNIGHTESAAGVAGLIKVLLMMKHETIVPSVFYSEDSASVDAKALNIKVPTEAEEWKTSGQRIAGVNNFGFGGTNAHAIVKQHKQLYLPGRSNGKHAKYFVLSAYSHKSLKLMLEDTIRQLDTICSVDLDTLVYTSACRRSHKRHRYRKAILTSSPDDIKDQLKSALSKQIAPSFLDPKLVFVFCGNGLTYHGMCKQLLKHEPVFRHKIQEVAQHFQRFQSNFNILDTLDSVHESSDPARPHVVQPLLFAIQVGIATLLKHWGVKPDAILGHSVGEVAAAHCSGLLSLEDAVKVIYHRSALQDKVTGGKMLVISNMAVSEVVELLPRYSNKVCIAAFNSPQSCTLSGDADGIKSLHDELNNAVNRHNLFLRTLDVPAAYHSYMMEPILFEIKESIGHLQVNSLESELFSTLTGRKAEHLDFTTGEYWARNIREPVCFEQAVQSVAKGKRNLVFVEIGPRRALERNIIESLGSDTSVFASVQPDKDHESMIKLVSKLFEAGVQVDWNQFYRGCETAPLPFPIYQFDCSQRDVIIGAAQQSTAGNHPVLFQTGNENIFTCDLKSESSAYLQEHKHNGIPIIPGAFYVELGLAAFIACAKPKVPLKSAQLSVDFQSPFIFNQNAPEMKVKLQPVGNATTFTIFSQSAVYASGTVVSKQERLMEEQLISLNSIYKRCKYVVSFEEFYGYLAKGGFQYGDIFQNKMDVHYGEDLMEAFSVVIVPDELRSKLHDYCIHPVILDFFMQLLPVAVAHAFAGRPGFPAKIGSLTIFEPLQNEMIVYLRAIDIGVDHFEVCGCFLDKEGRVLVEIRHVLIKYLGSHSHVVDEYFYNYDYIVVSQGITSCSPPKALVFCDTLGISKALQKHLDPASRYISLKHAKDILSHGFRTLLRTLSITEINKNFDEVLFLWGKEDLSSMATDVVLQSLVTCCETFRQIVLELKVINFTKDIRAITYCSSEITVDHISPGFSLSGMTRSFAAEIPHMSFQLIDIESTSDKDITALSDVLKSYPSSKYPELVVKDGLILKPSITRTTAQVIDNKDDSFCFKLPETCVLKTTDAYEITNLLATHSDLEDQPITETSVEIQLNKICVHSSDYFPVSDSHWKFGQTIYWNTHTSQKHNLLAVDFSGIITAVGKDVKKLKVGNDVVCCYPVEAATKIVVPQEVCYSAKKFPFLQKTPCVSYFVLAWEILHKALPKAKQHLGIISSVPDSALVKVLSVTSHKSGWNVIVGTQCPGLIVNVNQIDAFILLSPFDESLITKIGNYPGVRDVVAICESQSQCSLIQDAFKNVKQSVYMQTIQMPSILQKGSLCAQRRHIYHWLKSLNLNRESLALDSFTFQSVAFKDTNILSLKRPKSYFTLKCLPIVVLAKDTLRHTSRIPVLTTKRKLFKNRAVYIVTGGLSGLGFETVKFISQRGGRYIVILSRSSPSPAMQQEIQKLERQCGSCITSMECDVSVSEHVHKVISAIGKKFACPVRGVFHSAVVLHDGLIETLDVSLYEKVFKPKVNGVLNLHHATQHCQLDYFVCYSSISAFLGNASQTNYAAANTFLDTFCQYRRKLGLPGQSINWGAMNLGLLLNKEHFQKFLEAKGMMVLDVTEVHKSLDQCLRINRPQQAVCRFHFKNIRYNVLSQNAALTMRLSALVEEAFQKSKEVDSETKQTVSVSPEEYVRSLLSETIGIDESELNDEIPISSLGIDSMLAMTLQNLIFQEKGVNIPLVKLLDPNATLSTVVVLLSEGSDNQEPVQPENMDAVYTRL